MYLFLQDCSIFILDHTDTITVDDCINCQIVIGPCRGRLVTNCPWILSIYTSGMLFQNLVYIPFKFDGKQSTMDPIKLLTAETQVVIYLFAVYFSEIVKIVKLWLHVNSSGEFTWEQQEGCQVGLGDTRGDWGTGTGRKGWFLEIKASVKRVEDRRLKYTITVALLFCNLLQQLCKDLGATKQ